MYMLNAPDLCMLKMNIQQHTTRNYREPIGELGFDNVSANMCFHDVTNVNVFNGDRNTCLDLISITSQTV